MNKSPKGAGSNHSAPPDSKRRERRSPASEDWLGDQLRDLYGGFADEPLPDELQTLLERLDDKSGGRGKGS